METRSRVTSLTLAGLLVTLLAHCSTTTRDFFVHTTPQYQISKVCDNEWQLPKYKRFEAPDGFHSTLGRDYFYSANSDYTTIIITVLDNQCSTKIESLAGSLSVSEARAKYPIYYDSFEFDRELEAVTDAWYEQCEKQMPVLEVSAVRGNLGDDVSQCGRLFKKRNINLVLENAGSFVHLFQIDDIVFSWGEVKQA